jgi:DNA polymerase III alpha subunit (gram-positive type)
VRINMLIREILDEDNSKRNKLLYFRQTVDSILAKTAGKVIIVFDTETSGLSVKLPWVQVTEIAAIAFEADTGKQLGTFHKKINLTPATKDEIKVQRRNITPTDRGSLEGPRGANIPDLFRMSRYGDNDAPRGNIKEVYQGFVDFINQYNDPILLGQNVAFDMGQMFAPLKKLGIQRPQHGEVLDTMTLGRTWIYPLLKAGEAAGDSEAAEILQGFNNTDKNGNVKLSFSLKNLGRAFDVSAKHWHSGISDAMQTYDIFVKMLEYLKTAKDKGYDTSDEFKKQHASMSGKAFSYGKRPAFGSTVDSDRSRGIAARGRPRD